MTLKTVTSEEVRNHLRDILDETLAGREVVIERYRKPTAVVVSYEKWQALQQRHLAMLAEQSRLIDAGEYFTHEQVVEGMRERGLID